MWQVRPFSAMNHSNAVVPGSFLRADDTISFISLRKAARRPGSTSNSTIHESSVIPNPLMQNGGRLGPPFAAFASKSVRGFRRQCPPVMDMAWNKHLPRSLAVLLNRHVDLAGDYRG